MSTTTTSSSRRSETIRFRSLNVGALCTTSNVFEFYQDLESDEYQRFMSKTAELMNHPTPEFNVTLNDLMRDNVTMLFHLLKEEFPVEVLYQLRHHWETKLSGTTVVNFLRDQTLAAQRLVSYPDRLTSQNGTQFRPAVTTANNEQYFHQDDWFLAWCAYMFETQPRTIDAITSIPAKKYPAFTAELEPINRPLQLLCLALFDACMFHLAQSTQTDWHSLKQCLLENQKKQQTATLQLIFQTPLAHGWCLQECSGEFLTALQATQEKLTDPSFLVMVEPGHRQLSVILINREWALTVNAIDSALLDPMAGLVAAEVVTPDGHTFVVASAHADSNGVSTPEILKRVAGLESCRKTIVLGIDANTYATPRAKKNQLTLTQFQLLCRDGGWTNTWACHGGLCDTNHTTHNARTFVQPQFSKALLPHQIATMGNHHPKDHFLLHGNVDGWKTCTRKYNRQKNGELSWHPTAVFPNPYFPCDHALVELELTCL